MAYNSSHTGAQIDSAVGKVIEKEATWDGKQGKLTGKKGQIVGFDADGHAVAQDAPTKGMTEAEADAKYLPLAGGKMTGAITGGDSENWVYKSYDVTDSAGIRVAAGMQARERNVALSCRTSDGESTIGIGENAAFIQSGVGGQGTSRIMVTPIGVTINNVVTPATDTMPTPKSYVDKLKTKAHKVTLTVAGWNSSTKQQTVAVADVVADETAQLILPMPAAASMTAYNDAGIQCTAQAAGKLTFTADTVPTVDIAVYVTIAPVSFS